MTVPENHEKTLSQVLLTSLECCVFVVLGKVGVESVRVRGFLGCI
jgi:hypothetical protein